MKKKELFMDDLQHLFKSDLKHTYYIEKLHAKALVRIVKELTDPEMIQSVENILDQCIQNRQSIEKIFDNLEIKPRGKKSKGIEGMITESREIINKSEKLTYVIVDAALLSAIQRILLYKIGAYKTLRSYAKLISNKFAADLLDSCYNDATKSENKISRLIVKRVKPKTVHLF
ncbi:MAG: hypothetical protein DHS20C13_04290 [Thermodesulfobacteriota bacterium]|nr:MAG: hypothetical protein DHS20C13_04290 [Thermodesulfobacteriota bacterium]